MPVLIAGKTYYRTLEAARKAGISRATLLRWVEKGIVGDAACRDRRGWRFFKESEIETLTREARKFKIG